jgi:predicted DCC family thiol-disulfide oxidoreductase YuxK
MHTQSEWNPRKAFSYREDASVPDFPDDRPIIIFDGHCVLCSRFARFVLRHDRRAVFRLMAAQTPLGQAIYRHYDLDPVNYESNVLLEEGRAWFKSEGTIRMFVHLGLPWSLARVLRLVPRGMLDRLYSVIARNRLRWFGSQSVCFLADPKHKDRFLE